MTEVSPILDDAPFHDLKVRETRLLEQIDAHGGWPVRAGSLVLKHGTDNRACYFSAKTDVRDGWNTSIMTADDYHWAKLSDARKETFAKERIRRALQNAMPR